jgi:hypothetical protein
MGGLVQAEMPPFRNFPLETLPESGTDAPDSIVMDTLDSLPHANG